MDRKTEFSATSPWVQGEGCPYISSGDRISQELQVKGGSRNRPPFGTHIHSK